MSACNACYVASTEPAWLAELVIRHRTDRPCDRHNPDPSDPKEEHRV